MPQVSIYLNKELYFKLQKATQKQNLGESHIVQEALKDYLARMEAKE